MSAHEIGQRYRALFAHRRSVFVPFFMLGDPDLETSAALLRAALAAGADALELGIPFSDPVADGPAIQRAALRARAAGATPERCFAMIATLREEFPTVPIGLLTYANLVVHGGSDPFYGRAHAAGVDSVLIADVPARESEPFSRDARAHGVAPILIAPPNASAETVSRIARDSDAYTYVVARKGVTGAGDRVALAHSALLEALRKEGAPPPLIGFGISRPEHLRAALDAGAKGAISGSAIANRIEESSGNSSIALVAVSDFVRTMVEATR